MSGTETAATEPRGEPPHQGSGGSKPPEPTPETLAVVLDAAAFKRLVAGQDTTLPTARAGVMVRVFLADIGFDAMQTALDAARWPVLQRPAPTIPRT
ncbi:MAG TPA: hypothetical protein VK741_25680 [Acetobacteraceae bacterium]|jgi:hypothetical protein|nr:hypothetical protein [Acetobacteraceae bacterium]